MTDNNSGQQPAPNPILSQEQIGMLVRLAFAAGTPLAAWLTAHSVSSDQISAIQTVLIMLIAAAGPVVAGVWGWLVHTVSARIASVEAIHGVTTVAVSSTASPELRAIAADDSRPKVVAAPPVAPIAVPSATAQRS
jgi:hypothetical protein